VRPRSHYFGELGYSHESASTLVKVRQDLLDYGPKEDETSLTLDLPTLDTFKDRHVSQRLENRSRTAWSNKAHHVCLVRATVAATDPLEKRLMRGRGAIEYGRVDVPNIDAEL
jgi:hypothetical protein